MASIHDDRLSRLVRAFPEAGLDALVLLPGPNLIYNTGLSFHLMGRPTMAVISRDEPPLLLVPDLERVKAEQGLPGALVESYGEDPADRQAAAGRVASRLGLGRRRVGVEPLRMRWMEEQLLRQAAPGIELVGAEAVLEPLRAEKSATEVAAIERAVAIAEQALRETLPSLRAGMTEHEAASELTLQLLRAGSEPELPFFPIIASGPNAALPHAVPTERRLEVGDLLIVDWGAAVNGYISDLTRTFSVGPPTDEWRRIHSLVAQANAAGRAAARPGTACHEVDRAARGVIDAAGYGPAFIHRTGHGIGLEAHEPPYVRADNEAPLRTGMTFTVEPGIYLPGRGGVRIEDNVVVTADGARTLSRMERDLVVLA
jgi:Xaa-Pro dipeptidase